VKDPVYRALVRVARYLGLWVVGAVAWVICTGYFVLLPRRLGCSIAFYQALFQGCGWLRALGLAWRQYHDFASVYSERLRLERQGNVPYDSEGEQYLIDATRNATGGVVLMSHFGRWELAARLLARGSQELTIVMGDRATGPSDEGIKQDLSGDGVRVISVPEGRGGGLEMLDAIEQLRAGKLISLAGDRIYGAQRVIGVPWAGKVVHIAAAPFALALAAGVPLLCVFAVKSGPMRYRAMCLAPRMLRSARRTERDGVLQAAALEYLEQLLALARRYPEQWHTFGPFLHDEPVPAGKG
jgi:predicted LPLAT superfamily acyltransferase